MFDLETKDSTKIEQAFGITSYSLTSSESIAVFNVRDYLNYIYLDQLENLGVQLSSSLVNDPFKVVTFTSESNPCILIRYVRSN